MNKIIYLFLFLTSISAAIADDASASETEKIQFAIRNAGYECEQVSGTKTETTWFDGTTTNVICDKVYRFLIRYERGGVTVEVISL
ncbi:TPA: hypothetical protein MI547_27015 [Klebsiella pneumoniae]|nr:hypothetical protein [Klebsiella pneumoniae]